MSATPLHVVKVGGAVVENPAELEAFLDGFAALDGAKILVHGGGRTATEVAGRLGVPTRMVAGRRVTDPGMLRVVTMVYAGLVNKTVIASLGKRGVRALGLCGADLDCIRGQRRPPVDMPGEGMVDFGCVGDVTSVQADAFAGILADGVVPVVAPLIHDGEGNLLNTNADTIASKVAAGLAAAGYAVTLTFCFEKPGVLSDPSDDSSVIPVIDPAGFERLLAEGTVSGGMVPKLTGAFSSLKAGVAEVVITSASALRGGTRIIP